MARMYESLRNFSLPSATEPNTWPFEYGAPTPFFRSYLAGGGASIGQVIVVANASTTGAVYQRTAANIMGNTTAFNDNHFGAVLPSPDGTLVAAVDSTGRNTQVFKIRALRGRDRCLVGTAIHTASPPQPDGTWCRRTITKSTRNPFRSLGVRKALRMTSRDIERFALPQSAPEVWHYVATR